MTKPQPRTAADVLAEMSATYRERNKIYKDNFVRLGAAMHALFPEGVTVDTPDDWVRLYFFFLTMVKKSRYATNWKKGGHKDSIHDSAVYAAMLEAFDEHVVRVDDSKVVKRNVVKKKNAPARTQANGNGRGFIASNIGRRS